MTNIFLKPFIKLLVITAALFASTSFAIIKRIPSAPELEAKSFVLMDFNSQQVLSEKDADLKIDPASLTKMMTTYVVDHEIKSGHISLTDLVDISEEAWKAEGSKMFIEAGKKVSVEDLVRGVIIQSGNDASVALAEYVAGSEKSFAQLMNQYAKHLGMKNTHFKNSTGIPEEGQYSTARDLAILARAKINDFPETYDIYSEKWFTYNGIKQPNRNRLLWREPYVDGIKTGSSSTAGYCLAASGQKDGMRLISILVGAQNDNERTEQSQQLLRYGFRFFETHKLFAKDQPISSPRVWMGEKKKVGLGINKDLYITVPRGLYESVEAKMHLDSKLTAPLQNGETVGTVEVKLGDELLANETLYSLDTIQSGSIWNRLSDYVSMGLHKILKSKPQIEAGSAATES